MDSSKQYARVKGSLLPVVLVLRGETPRPFYVLSARENLAGRGEGSLILLDDAGCSRRHFVLHYENITHPEKVPLVSIEDAGSRNGTLLNGLRITERMPLKFGDRIQAGNTIMCFVIRTVAEVEAESATKTSSQMGDAVEHNRVSVHCEAQLSLNLPDQTGTPMKMSGTLEDVSASGMRFRSNEPPKVEYLEAVRPMRTARMTTTLPGTTAPLDVTGRIAWIHKDSQGCVMLGLEIHGIADEERDALLRYIQTNG